MFKIKDLRALFPGPSSVLIVTDAWDREIAIPRIAISRLAQASPSIADESFRQIQQTLTDRANQWQPPRYPIRIIFDDESPDDGLDPSMKLTVPQWFSTWAQSCGIEIRYRSELTFLDSNHGELENSNESR